MLNFEGGCRDTLDVCFFPMVFFPWGIHLLLKVSKISCLMCFKGFEFAYFFSLINEFGP